MGVELEFLQTLSLFLGQSLPGAAQNLIGLRIISILCHCRVFSIRGRRRAARRKSRPTQIFGRLGLDYLIRISLPRMQRTGRVVLMAVMCHTAFLELLLNQRRR